MGADFVTGLLPNNALVSALDRLPLAGNCELFHNDDRDSSAAPGKPDIAVSSGSLCVCIYTRLPFQELGLGISQPHQIRTIPSASGEIARFFPVVLVYVLYVDRCGSKVVDRVRLSFTNRRKTLRGSANVICIEPEGWSSRGNVQEPPGFHIQILPIVTAETSSTAIPLSFRALLCFRFFCATQPIRSVEAFCIAPDSIDALRMMQTALMC